MYQFHPNYDRRPPQPRRAPRPQAVSLGLNSVVSKAILNSNGIIRYKTLFQMSDETEEITARKDFSRFTRWWLADMNDEVKKN